MCLIKECICCWKESWRLTYFAMYTLADDLLKCIISPRGNFLRSSQNCEKRLLDPSCLSVRPSTWNSSSSTGRILIDFDIRVLFKNLPRWFKFHYNVTRITRTLHADLCSVHLWQSLWILLRMRNVLGQKL